MIGPHDAVAPPGEVELIPVADPLLREPSLSFTVTLPVLGIATRFETNSRTVLGLVVESFGAWRAFQSVEAPRAGADNVTVRIIVSDGDEGTFDGAHAPVRHLSPDDGRFIVQSPGSVAVSDPARRGAVAYVSRALVADAAHFRAELLEAVTLALLCELDRHPVHAAAVARDGRAVLLAAPSGTGKSSLAYACHAAGFDLLGEDRVWVQLEPATRIWGAGGGVRLLVESAARLALALPASPTDERQGRAKVRIESAPGLPAPPGLARDFTVCVLSREGGSASIEPLAPDALARALGAQLAAGFDRFPRRWPAVAAALSARGGWKLSLSDDPRDAVPFVRELTNPTGGVHE
jgi:hypothetical protein